MAKIIVILAVFIVSNAFLPLAFAGTVALQHRDTSLDELKSIDSYVSGGFPSLSELQDGFFVGTSSGPVLVKSGIQRGAKNRPAVRAKYYNTLPRLIPAGFEGIAVSHFNLGAANPYRPLSPTVPLAAQPQQYIAAHVAQPSQQYVAQPVVDQNQQVYQSQQYVAEAQQPQEYVSQPEQYVNEQSQQQFIQSEQPQQQFIQTEQHHQQFLQNEQPQQFLQQDPSHQQQQYLQPEQTQQQYLQSEQSQQHQFLQHESAQQQQQQQQPFQFHQQYLGSPSQLIPEQSIDSQQAAQEPAQISARSQPSAPVAEPSFQVDNLLRPEQEQNSVTTFQTQVFGRERFQSQKLLRNAAVVATTDFEETLPETLRNSFYKNANLATILAQESLPIQGEQIINEWDTNKIAKEKIRALLRGAGFI